MALKLFFFFFFRYNSPELRCLSWPAGAKKKDMHELLGQMAVHYKRLKGMDTEALDADFLRDSVT